MLFGGGGGVGGGGCVGALWKACGTLHVWGSSYGSCLYQKLRPFWEVKLAGISSILTTKMSVAIATIAEFLKPFLGVVLMYA